MADRLDDVADELYALAPKDFTAARNQHEKQARAAGDKELAAGIHALAKPSVAAWLVNQLARERRDELEPFLELGSGLREATERLAGEELRRLSQQQHELVYALVQQARQLARATGHRVSDDTARGVEDTLHAALADEDAAQQLLAGRLTDVLHSSGFGGAVETTGRTPAASSRRAPSGGRAPSDDRLERAERDLADAEDAVAEAERGRADAQSRVAEADDAVAAANEQVEQVRQALEQATAAAAEAERARRDLAAALRRAERAVHDAERRRKDAAARRDRLVGGD